MNAVGACGLQLYNFGQTVSLVFFTDNWKPDSFYDRVKENADLGCHTLLLLDIKVKEQSEENMARSALCFATCVRQAQFYYRGRKIYEPPRYMSIPTAVQQLNETEEKRGQGILDPQRTLAIALSRVGGVPSSSTSDGADVSSEDRGQTIIAGTLAELLTHPPSAFGPPLHSLVLVGKRLHHLEVEYAEAFAINKEHWREVASSVYGCALD
jgi:diphthine synthase